MRANESMRCDKHTLAAAAAANSASKAAIQTRSGQRRLERICSRWSMRRGLHARRSAYSCTSLSAFSRYPLNCVCSASKTNFVLAAVLATTQPPHTLCGKGGTRKTKQHQGDHPDSSSPYASTDINASTTTRKHKRLAQIFPCWLVFRLNLALPHPSRIEKSSTAPELCGASVPWLFPVKMHTNAVLQCVMILFRLQMKEEHMAHQRVLFSSTKLSFSMLNSLRYQKQTTKRDAYHEFQAEVGKVLTPRSYEVRQVDLVGVVVRLPRHLHEEAARLDAEQRRQLLAVLVPPHHLPGRA